MVKNHDWQAIAASQKFKKLVTRKRIVLSGLMLFSIAIRRGLFARIVQRAGLGAG